MWHISNRILLPVVVVILVLVSLGAALTRTTEPSPVVPYSAGSIVASPNPLSGAATPSPTSSESPVPSLVDISQSLRVENGQVLEGEFFSETLRTRLPYRVFLPAGYASSSERYPVVYLLHGGGSSYVEWTANNHAALFADAMISEARIRPMILVMPEGDHSYFMNHAVDGQRWGDYIALELVDYIDGRFRTVATREGRAVGGLSMGGTGALQLAFNHPDRFSIAQANSPSLRLDLLEAPEYLGEVAYYAGYDPILLAASRAREIRGLDISIDIGEQDEWFGAAERLHEALEENAVEHQFLARNGYHWTTYWIEYGPEYLSYYSRAFDRRLGGLPISSIDGPAAKATSLSTDPTQETGSIRQAIQGVIRGARVYAALPDSPYMARTAKQAMADLREQLSRQQTARFEKTTGLFADLETAVSRMDIGAMRHLSDHLEGALDEEAPDTP